MDESEFSDKCSEYEFVAHEIMTEMDFRPDLIQLTDQISRYCDQNRIGVDPQPLRRFLRIARGRLEPPFSRVIPIPSESELAQSYLDAQDVIYRLVGAPEPMDPADPLVRLSQVAGLIHKSKNTIRKWPLPKPEERGGRGKPNRWRWSTMRSFLRQYDPALYVPERFPGVQHSG